MVAWIQGYCLGGGCGLAACVDIAVAAEDAVFGFSEVKLGIIPAVISPFVLAKIGSGAARRYFLTGERFGADVALRIGLVSEIGPSADAGGRRAPHVRPERGARGEAASSDRTQATDAPSPSSQRECARATRARTACARSWSGGSPAGSTDGVRRLLFLVGGIVFVDTMFFVALTPLLPDYAEQYDLSKAGVGVLAGAYPIGALAGGIPGGLATARFGARPTTIAGVLVIAVTTMIFATGDSIVVLDIARFVQGFGSAFAWTAGLTWLVGATPADRRGQTIGLAMSAAIVGALFGPVLGGVASVVGQAAAFGAAALVAVALAVWAFFTDAPPPTRPQPLRLFVRALRNRPHPAQRLVRRPTRTPLRDDERPRAAAAGGPRLHRRGDRRSLALHGGRRGDREPARRADHGPGRPDRADDGARARLGRRRGGAPLAEHAQPSSLPSSSRPASPSAASGRPRWRSSPTRPRLAGSSTRTPSR